MSKQLKPTQTESKPSTVTVGCPFCGHKRSLIQFSESNTGTEAVWCPKCSNTYTYDRGTRNAYITDDVHPI